MPRAETASRFRKNPLLGSVNNVYSRPHSKAVNSSSRAQDVVIDFTGIKRTETHRKANVWYSSRRLRITYMGQWALFAHSLYP